MPFKTKPMRIADEYGAVNLEIERDSGNGFLILMSSRTEYALKNWRKLRRLTGKAIKILEERQKIEKRNENVHI